ncbi:GntR family transcriptional regulator [Paractinoplanes lichenicola]|uniref:GntR family transcriptional regulator n=1 Tax=Paractinoplanes lichenicola TaxID=2802976 RepID=A0ABS1VDU2_9ACTN|nr:GntR family transcriptional regulator [Actinoplanes lichenicola]MBL7252850.1 GntR family transcriptional regulator [Actinoplanes lichenicola]
MRAAAEQAAQALRDEILSGAIPSGARLGEAELAGRLSVSRTPIREALSRLAAEGLVEIQPNRGARVASWSSEQLRDIFELRLRLEPYAVRQAVPNLDAEQIAELDELAAEMMRVGKPGRNQNLAAIVELNRRFHGLFIDAAGSPPLAQALRGVTHAAVVTQNFHDYAPAALLRSLHHHVEMVAAARAGAGEWAEAIMRAHLYNARATMIGHGPEEAGAQEATTGRGSEGAGAQEATTGRGSEGAGAQEATTGHATTMGVRA